MTMGRGWLTPVTLGACLLAITILVAVATTASDEPHFAKRALFATAYCYDTERNSDESADGMLAHYQAWDRCMEELVDEWDR